MNNFYLPQDGQKENEEETQNIPLESHIDDNVKNSVKEEDERILKSFENRSEYTKSNEGKVFCVYQGQRLMKICRDEGTANMIGNIYQRLSKFSNGDSVFIIPTEIVEESPVDYNSKKDFDDNIYLEYIYNMDGTLISGPIVISVDKDSDIYKSPDKDTYVKPLEYLNNSGKMNALVNTTMYVYVKLNVNNLALTDQYYLSKANEARIIHLKLEFDLYE